MGCLLNQRTFHESRSAFIKEKVGQVTAEQVRKITETKFEDLNAHDLDQAEKIIRGTARSMGIEVIDKGL